MFLFLNSFCVTTNGVCVLVRLLRLAHFFYFRRADMIYDKDTLYEINIYCLRNIAKQVGIPAPTTLTKKELIDELLKRQTGQPPLLHNGETTEEVLDKATIERNAKQQFIKQILSEIEKQLNSLL